MEKEICKTYFKIKDKTIDGYKVTEVKGIYYIYVYTSCKRIGNWQQFLNYNNYNDVLKYFKNIVNNFNEEIIIHQNGIEKRYYGIRTP